jgi:hypothetical protein
MISFTAGFGLFLTGVITGVILLSLLWLHSMRSKNGFLSFAISALRSKGIPPLVLPPKDLKEALVPIPACPLCEWSFYESDHTETYCSFHRDEARVAMAKEYPQ